MNRMDWWLEILFVRWCSRFCTGSNDTFVIDAVWCWRTSSSLGWMGRTNGDHNSSIPRSSRWRSFCNGWPITQSLTFGRKTLLIIIRVKVGTPYYHQNEYWQRYSWMLHTFINPFCIIVTFAHDLSRCSNINCHQLNLKRWLISWEELKRAPQKRRILTNMYHVLGSTPH